ncbi:MAG: hypothetical protein OEM64_02820 [Gammaproteobacteria bacterium]|nr:hypothetical protein [Gammaproteobacteria bacterium]MDH3415222.1 hypothetical protein [Gammaproteobacteria bacterium]
MVASYIRSDRFPAAPLAFDPGTRWGYGIGTDVLGVLMTQIMPFFDPEVLSLLDHFETAIYRQVNASK